MTERPEDERFGAQAWLSRLPLSFARPVTRYALATGAVALALAGRFALDPVLPPGFPFLTFFPTILIVCFVLGLGPAVAAAVAGLSLGWYFFLGPVHSFALNVGVVAALTLYVVSTSLVVSLIHGLQQANRRLARERQVGRELAAHREVLFLELQHRVGNNLQMVGSVLALQKRHLVEPEARRAVDDAARRISLIGRVQRSLYRSDGAPIALAEYLDQITTDLIATSGRDDIDTTVVADAAIRMRPALAIPVALMTVEAVANAIEHGLGEQAGRIRVEAAVIGDAIALAVRDDGAGLPDGFSLEGASSLGIRLCTSLARHHGGAFVLTREGEWTCARVSLPVEG